MKEFAPVARMCSDPSFMEMCHEPSSVSQVTLLTTRPGLDSPPNPTSILDEIDRRRILESIGLLLRADTTDTEMFLSTQKRGTMDVR